MKVKYGEINLENLMKEILELCEKFQAYRIEEKTREECGEVKRRLEELCEEGRMRIGEADAGLLLALMDAYEVTRDEGMLQEVLDAVSGVLDELRPSPVNVKLLSYCYFYTEDRECALLARQMLNQLRGDKRVKKAELAEVIEVYGELVEGD